ncbi:fungal-specific transcription factor domain-containing protein [Mycena galopus ATCC 62051]|nr:fungal-specific transcription factor domain-containing protein [Mycena galopus ATCC 62051]
MTSWGEDYDKLEVSHRKRRRVQRACDFCRRRKTRCDGAQMPGSRCTACLTANVECAYVESPVTPSPKSYVDSLEARLEHSEAMVRQLRTELADIYFANSSLKTPPKRSLDSSEIVKNTDNPGTRQGLNISHTPPKHSLQPSTQLAENHTAGPENREGLNVSLYVMRRTLRALGAPPPPPDADDLLHLELSENFNKFSLNPRLTHPFMGKSSGAAFVKAAIQLKEDVKREEREEALSHSTEPSLDDRIKGDRDAWTSRRPQYWMWRPWKNVARRTYTFRFPPKALMTEFVDLYFTRQNLYWPLLHRPTFERGIAEELHLRDDGFSVTVLLVCAIGSRWSSDPSMTEQGLACGWEWFNQVSQVVDPLFGQAGLYDLQYYCLAIHYLSGSSSGPHACWTLIGVGLRLAQDIGVHRRKAPTEVPSVERELFKRAFWVLVCLDRNMSAGMGRTCAMQFEDFDVDLPMEVDDEYWEHPTHPFQQPSGVPSRVAYFNTFIHLNHILAYSLKTLYSLDKVPTVFSSYKDWAEHAVPELDSALDNWHEQIPAHLCWDPTRTDPAFFAQSVSLQCWYHSLQIFIHRPLFLRKSAPTALPSRVACTNAARTCASAARACANILDVQRQRTGDVPVIVNLPAAFTSAIILLLVILSGKRTGLVPDPTRDMANVYKCMEVVRLCEGRWQTAGLMWDILAELASVGQLTLPKSLPKGRESTETDEQRSRRAHSRPLEGQPSVAGLGEPVERICGTSIFALPPDPNPDQTFADMYTTSVQAIPELEDMLDIIDRETIAMWTNAPRGLQADDWGTYFSNFNEITQGPGGG